MKRLFLRSAIFLAVTVLAGPASDRLAMKEIGSWFVPPAQAIIGLPFTPLSFAGVARRTAYRSVAVADTTMAASAAAESNAAAAQAQATAAAAAKPATVVMALPSGCTSVPSGGVSYFYCAGTYYRPYFSGGNLVYAVVAAP